MRHLLLLLLMVVVLSFCSTTADVAAHDGEPGAQMADSLPLNRLRLWPTALSTSESIEDDSPIQYLHSKHLAPSNPSLGNYGSPACMSEGRIADPYNCGQFYDCVRGRSGELIANKQSCFGHAFDATLKSCVSATMAKGCSLDSNSVFRSVPAVDPTLQKICKTNDNEFICMDCKTLIMCVDRKPYIIPCKAGNVCYNSKENFNGGVCYPDAPSECTCNNDDIFRKDYYDPSKFLSCDSKGADPVVQSCPDGLEFDEQSSSCGTPIDTSCSEAGTFALKTDCNKYHTCIYTTSGWFQRDFSCNGNTMYNEYTGQCEDPCDWYDGNFVCTEEGRFSNPSDCTTFFECIADPSDASKFIQMEHVCPEGYEWLPMVDRHHCVAKGSTKEKCVPQKPSICEIPSEWCPSNKDEAPTPAPTTTSTTTTAPPPTADDICSAAGGNMMGTRCLFFSSGAVTCDVARTACSNKGGALADLVDNPSLGNNYESGTTIWIEDTNTYDENAVDAGISLHHYMLALENEPHFAYHSCAETKEYICEIVTTELPVPRKACPNDHFQVGSQCFFIPKAGFKTWYRAQDYCIEHGGFLAEPDSIPEFHEALSKETSDYGFWLGGSMRKPGGDWRWSSQRSMVGNLDSWYTGEPSLYHPNAKCLFLMRGMEKPLAARNCDQEHHYFVCQKY